MLSGARGSPHDLDPRIGRRQQKDRADRGIGQKGLDRTRRHEAMPPRKGLPRARVPREDAPHGDKPLEIPQRPRMGLRDHAEADHAEAKNLRSLLRAQAATLTEANPPRRI